MFNQCNLPSDGGYCVLGFFGRPPHFNQWHEIEWSYAMSSWTNFFPYVAMAIKLIALGIGGYYAIKWHFDQDKKLKLEAEKEKAKLSAGENG